MAILDLAIYIIIGVAAVTGYRRGFISQASSLAAIVIGIIACRVLGPTVTDLVVGADANGLKRFAASVMAYICIYAVVGIGVKIVGRVLGKISHALLLGPLDGVAGAALSIAKWMIGISLVLNLYIAFNPMSDAEGSDIAADLPLSAVVKIAPAIFGFTDFNALENETKR